MKQNGERGSYERSRQNLENPRILGEFILLIGSKV